jgi:hypothetical protein
MRGRGDGSIGEPLRSGKWLGRTESGGPAPKGLYIARTLVQDCQEVPVRVLNATHSEQKLMK